MTATGLPPKTFLMSDGGLESQSIAFFKTPGIELLYSGVTNSKPSALAIVAFNSATRLGMPSAASTSPLYSGMPSILSVWSAALLGISSTAARSSALLNEPRRRLPEIPTILDTVLFTDMRPRPPVRSVLVPRRALQRTTRLPPRLPGLRQCRTHNGSPGTDRRFSRRCRVPESRLHPTR